MIDTKKLCTTMGIDKDTFYIFMDKKGIPFMHTEVGNGRQLSKDDLDIEGMLLYDAEKLLKDTKDMLEKEIQAIQRFRRTFYGPDHKGDNTDKKEPNPS